MRLEASCAATTASRLARAEEAVPLPTRPLTRSNGTPAPTNPSFSLATPGPRAIGVPNFFIDKFRIPPFLLPIYQAAGMQYGVRWEVLAAINEIETDYGRNLNVSSAGALGWMQFMPATWKTYGVDANRDGVKDPFNPVDAIFAAARYLRAAGADKDLRRAIFAYNHADWYVDSVLMRAQRHRRPAGRPRRLAHRPDAGPLPGPRQGDLRRQRSRRPAARSPRHERRRRRRVRRHAASGIDIYARAGAPVIAVNDGRVVKLGHSKRLGRYVELQDVYGNTYTYAHLGDGRQDLPGAEEAQGAQGADPPRARPAQAPTPSPRAPPATRKRAAHARAPAARRQPAKQRLKAAPRRPSRTPRSRPPRRDKERLFAHPDAPERAASPAATLQLARPPATRPQFGAGSSSTRATSSPSALRKGARVIGGTVLGRIGRTRQDAGPAPAASRSARPAAAPRASTRSRSSTAGSCSSRPTIYRAKGKNPFFGADAETPSIGQIMLMSKEALARRVLADPRIDIYGCGRHDIRTGQIDRRVLATLEFLASSGLKPTVSSLKCGHGYLTTSGNVSEHSTGTAVDIAAINGIADPRPPGPGLDHRPDDPAPADPAGHDEAAPDHLPDDLRGRRQHARAWPTTTTTSTSAGARSTASNAKAAKQIDAILKPKQWIKLIDRLGEIDNPTVREAPVEVRDAHQARLALARRRLATLERSKARVVRLHHHCDGVLVSPASDPTPPPYPAAVPRWRHRRRRPRPTPPAPAA